MKPNYNVYIYPNNNYKYGKSENSYLEDLGDALENKGCTILNGNTGWLGPLDFLDILNKQMFFLSIGWKRSKSLSSD